MAIIEAAGVQRLYVKVPLAYRLMEYVPYEALMAPTFAGVFGQQISVSRLGQDGLGRVPK